MHFWWITCTQLFEGWKGRLPLPQNNMFVKFSWFPRHFWKPIYPWCTLPWTLGEPQMSFTIPILGRLKEDNKWIHFWWITGTQLFEEWKGRPPFPQNNMCVTFSWFPVSTSGVLCLGLWVSLKCPLQFLVASLNKDNISTATNLSPIPTR